MQHVTSGPMSLYIEAQRPNMYDYIVRMTGNIGRAESAILEAVRIALHMDNLSEDQAEVRVSLFKMARKFTADVWYGEFKLMVDKLYDDFTGPSELRKIELAIDDLPSNQKEFLLLHYRYEFSVAQIAELTSKPLATVNSGLKVALKNLSESFQIGDAGLIKELVQVPFIKHETQTQAIDELLESIKQPVRLPIKILSVGIFFSAIYFAWKFGTLAILWEKVSSWF